MIPKRNDLKKILNEHLKWIFSSGRVGKLADVNNWKLDKYNLENEDFPFAKLQFVSFRGANLSGINFRQADLLMGNFIGAYLDGADLEGANLSGGDLSFSKCMGANFANTNLEDANFEGADLSETNFAKAILRSANFKGANLLSAELSDADIEGANFQGANLEGTNLQSADLFKADFDETFLINHNIKKINLPEADDGDTNHSDTIQNEAKSPVLGYNKHNIDQTTQYQWSNSTLGKENLSVDSNTVDSDMINEAISDLIEKIKSNIQFDQVKAICKNQRVIDKVAEFDFKQGDIVTHNGQVAIKLEYNISYNLSLLLDRNGKLIKFSAHLQDNLINEEDLE